LEDFGGSGIVSAVDMFKKSHTVTGVIVLGGFILWILISLYDVWIFYQVRLLLNAGGLAATSIKAEVANAAAAVVVENKEAIAQTVYDNRATIGSVIKQQATAVYAAERDPYVAQPPTTYEEPARESYRPVRTGPMPGRSGQSEASPPWNHSDTGDSIFSGKNV